MSGIFSFALLCFRSVFSMGKEGYFPFPIVLLYCTFDGRVEDERSIKGLTFSHKI